MLLNMFFRPSKTGDDCRNSLTRAQQIPKHHALAAASQITTAKNIYSESFFSKKSTQNQTCHSETSINGINK